MTDLEITRLCAEVMGISVELEYWAGVGAKVFVTGDWDEAGNHYERYHPLEDDAQAMALVKKFYLGVAFSGGWSVYEQGNGAAGHSANLNRAICLCVAKMQQARAA